MKKTAGALLVLLGLVSGACGGETTSSTKAAYIAEMDRRCKLAQDELAALPEPEGRAEAAERLKTMEELYRGLQKDLRTQRPSNGDDATLETFLDGGDRALRQMAVAHEAAAANDKARFEKAVAELNGISDAAAVAGREYGFKVCASPDASTDSGPDGQGEPDERVFEDDRFELTFRYPSSFFEGRVNDTARSVGRDPSAQAVLGLDDDNAIILSKYVNDSPVTAADVAEALPQFDTQISELAGKEVTGAAVQVAGLPGIRYYDVDVPGMGNQRSRLVFLFSGRNQYLVNCQWTSARRDELNTSCDRVLATLQKTPGVQGS